MYLQLYYNGDATRQVLKDLPAVIGTAGLISVSSPPRRIKHQLGQLV